MVCFFFFVLSSSCNYFVEILWYVIFFLVDDPCRFCEKYGKRISKHVYLLIRDWEEIVVKFKRRNRFFLGCTYFLGILTTKLGWMFCSSIMEVTISGYMSCIISLAGQKSLQVMKFLYLCKWCFYNIFNISNANIFQIV